MGLRSQHNEILGEVQRASHMMVMLVGILVDKQMKVPDGVQAHRLSWRGADEEPGMSVRIEKGSYEVDYVLPPPEEMGQQTGIWCCVRYKDPEDTAEFIGVWLGGKVEEWLRRRA